MNLKFWTQSKDLALMRMKGTYHDLSLSYTSRGAGGWEDHIYIPYFFPSFLQRPQALDVFLLFFILLSDNQGESDWLESTEWDLWVSGHLNSGLHTPQHSNHCTTLDQWMCTLSNCWAFDMLFDMEQVRFKAVQVAPLCLTELFVMAADDEDVTKWAEEWYSHSIPAASYVIPENICCINPGQLLHIFSPRAIAQRPLSRFALYTRSQSNPIILPVLTLTHILS